MGTQSARWFFSALFYLLPNLANYSYITPAAHGQQPTPAMLGAALVYALIYISVLLAAATLIFNRRNFK
jgi:ABC-type transport system involved in multi-copper enzyme maturation permease subunit